MKSWLVFVFGLAALVCALRAAFTSHLAGKVEPEPEGLEPFEPEMKQAWWWLAEYKGKQKAGALNSEANGWAGAAAIFAFAAVIAGIWP
jgi:hypothetical protein